MRMAVFIGGCALILILLSSSPARAQQTDKITHLEAYLAADEAYQAADLEGRLAIVDEAGKSQRVRRDIAAAMQLRILQEHIVANGLDQDLPALMKWLGGMAKDRNHPISKVSGSAIREAITVYGPQRLYQDESFRDGDIVQKLLTVTQYWRNRELPQGMAYELHNDLVSRYLAPAGDDIEKSLERFGELLQRDAVMWECSGGVHRALMWRALHELPGLDTTEKKLAFIQELVGKRQIGSLTPGRVPSTLLITTLASDNDFLALDPEDRAQKIRQWEGDKLIDRSNSVLLLGVFASVE